MNNEVKVINEAMQGMKTGEELFQFINLLLKQKEEREVSAK